MDLAATASGASIDVNALAWDLGASKSFLVDDVSVVPLVSTTPAPAPAPAPPPTTSSPSGVLPAQGTGALFGYYGSGGADPAPWRARSGASST